MAMSPCDMHGTRYRGAAVHLYPAVLINGLAMRAHLRVCMLCAKETIEALQEHAKPPTEDGLYEALSEDRCAACTEPVGSRDVTCFLTAYLPNDERQDFWARYHLDCLDPPYRTAYDRQNGLKSSPGAA
jgi:hypothetical protein